MKILVVGDVHWSQYSSILRKRGRKYSYRLENLIQSVNWAEELADETYCDMIVYLGDFFDRSELNSEELSALREITWSSLPHYFLVGNHEAGRGDLSYNSVSVFELANFCIVQSVKELRLNDFNRVVFIPYILEQNRKPLSELITPAPQKTIVFSHNDIKGYQMGNFISQEGFDIVDIDKSCDLYLNGHLHNGGRITEKIINVCNLTGQNFSEDAYKYSHTAIVLDTKESTCAVYENPYALNFYKLDFTDDKDCSNTLEKLKENCVVTVRCNEHDVSAVRTLFESNPKIVESRFVIQLDKVDNIEKKQEELHIDYLNQFAEYMTNCLGSSELLDYELQKVCG